MRASAAGEGLAGCAGAVDGMAHESVAATTRSSDRRCWVMNAAPRCPTAWRRRPVARMSAAISGNHCERLFELASKRSPRCRRAHPGYWSRRSMNLRLRDCAAGEQEIEVATLVGLTDVGGVHRAVAARIVRGGWRPGGAAARDLLVGHVQVDAPRLGVDLDLVAGAHEGEGSADEALRRDM